MSVRVMADVWDYGPNDATLTSVLLALANFADDAGGNCFPGTPLVAKRTRYSERTIIRALQSLEEEGWITVLQRGNGRPVNGTTLEQAQYKTHFQINISRLKGCQPDILSLEKGDTEAEKGDTVTKKGDTDDKPPHPHNGRTVKEPSREPSEPDSVDNRVLCESIGIFNIRQQEEVFRLYKAYADSSKLSPSRAREKIIARWDEYQRKAISCEWKWGSAYKFLISGLWDKPDMWPTVKPANGKPDPMASMKFANVGGGK